MSKKDRISNVTCVSVLKSLEATHFKLPVKDRQFLPPTCHLKYPLLIQSKRHKQTSHPHPFTFYSFMSLTLPVTHPKEKTQTNLISMRFYLLILHATYTSRHISKEAETNLTPTPFYNPLLYATHISRYPTTRADTNKPHICVVLK
jgi:hypothetical protein